jgi:hypothetical protein
MVNVITRACRYLADHTPKEVTGKLPKEVTGDDVEAYALGLEHGYPSLSKDCVASAGGVQNFVQSQVVGGIITQDKAPRAADLFDMTFVQKVPRR